MHNRPRRTRATGQRKETLKEKEKLNSVVAAKTKGRCKYNCLRDVDEKYILDQRYMAWGQKYEQRASWILQMLNAFYLRTERLKRDKFKKKIGWRRSMQCVLCNNSRIFSEAIQTTESCTPSVRKSCTCVCKHVLLEGRNKDDGSPWKFSGVRWRGRLYIATSTNTAEGEQPCSAVDFIAHEHHKGRCVLFGEWGGEEDGGQWAIVVVFFS